MRKYKVYLKGAYGPGNIGDDILMLCVLNVLRRKFSDDEIAVGVEQPDLAKVLAANVNWLHIKAPALAETLVYGGGGQFFSFVPPTTGKKDSTYNFPGVVFKLINRIKAQSNIFDAILRIFLGWFGAYDKLIIADRASAYCIGLGPFDGMGSGLGRAREIIGKLNYISVRDSTSLDYVNNLIAPGKEVKLFTDPSFDASLWYEGEPNIYVTEEVRRCGYYSFIVRDWPLDENGANFIEAMLECARSLKSQGEKVRVVLLHETRDRILIERNPDFEWLIWSPERGSVSAFLEHFIRTSRVIVTARAHGAWLPAVLGIPSVVVAIENKLKEVSKTLSGGVVLVETPSVDEIKSAILQVDAKYVDLSSAVRSRIEINKSIAIKAANDFLEWL